MKLEIPEGYEIDLEKSCLKSGEVVLKKSNQFPKWEELGSISDNYIRGYYVGDDCVVREGAGVGGHSGTKNIFKTKAQAEASLAIPRLTQLMAHVNGDWEPDWGEGYTKYCINLYIGSKIQVTSFSHVAHFLKFKDKETAQGFLNAYEDLIKQAAPILWGIKL